MKNKIIILASIFLLLVGCNKQQPLSYEYLMQHPVALQKAMMQCRFDSASDTKCDVIKRAENDFSALVQEAQANPEEFGEKILRAEKLLADKRVALPKSEREYQDQLNQVNTLLAVVGMMRIE